MHQRLLTILAVASLCTAAACAKKTPPAGPDPFPAPGGGAGATTGMADPAGPPAPPPNVPSEPGPISGSPIGDPFSGKTPDEINDPAVSPLKPVFFEYDSDQLSDDARKALEENAAVLKKYQTWSITIEGHCDERGTSEYNLALGDRRALAAKNYLQSLGIPASRLNTVSYGKEFPFDPGHSEANWIQNRRAHFMVTAVK
jgi:peptidoglycan-associated lipoprotein